MCYLFKGDHYARSVLPGAYSECDKDEKMAEENDNFVNSNRKSNVDKEQITPYC